MQQWFSHPTHSLSFSVALLAINGTCSVRNIKKRAQQEQGLTKHTVEQKERGRGNRRRENTLPRRAGGEISKKNESKFTTHTTQASSVGNGDSWIINSARALRFFPLLHLPLPCLLRVTPLLCCCSAELTLTLFVVCLWHTQKNRLRLFIKPTKKRWKKINHICFLAA